MGATRLAKKGPSTNRTINEPEVKQWRQVIIIVAWVGKHPRGIYYAVTNVVLMNISIEKLR